MKRHTGSLEFVFLFIGALAGGQIHAQSIDGLLKAGQCAQQERFVLVIHGGVAQQVNDRIRERAAFVERLLVKGGQSLKGGATSLDIVQFAIQAMEDTGVFNAGKGSTRNRAGFIEMDASIMDGKTRKAGAVASITAKIKSPIAAARTILEKSDNVMFVGDRAEAFLSQFADLVGLESKAAELAISDSVDTAPPIGTVGAIALDRCGNLAAGTSTGGFGSKIPGRVGDSPIIGAGTIANEQVAVSGTGHGEYFIRWSVAHDIAALYAYRNMSIADAAKTALEKIVVAGGSGGVIAIDSKGEVATPFSTKAMVRGQTSNKQDPMVAID